jgi:tetratricopeptide (TPR) repeat protein
MERTTSVGGVKRVRVAAGSLALAAALAVGPLMSGVAWGQEAKGAKAVEPAGNAEPKQADDAAVKAKAEAEAKAKAKAEAEARAKAEVERKAKAEAKAKAEEAERRPGRLLAEAKGAYDAKNAQQAVAKYREFLSQYAGRPEAMSARYGLGVALAEMPDRDWNAVVEALSPVVTAEGIADKGKAYYYLGVALRVTGEQQLAGIAKPEEQKEQVEKATKRLASAVVQLTTAERVLSASVNEKPAADAKELPAALEMAARGRADAAEALVKLGKAKEAAELARGFVANPVWVKSKERAAGLTVLGEALFAQQDYPGAFAALAEVAPFADQLGTGLRAKYLLGRILQETGERPEAVASYEWVTLMYPMQRRKAEEALKDKARFRDRPGEQVRLEALTRGVPEVVREANYQAAQIQFEYGQFAEAAAKYQAFVQGSPNQQSETVQAARLRQGIAHARAKQLPEAMRALRPLAESPTLGDQATWWIGKVQRGSVAGTNPGALMQQTQAAIATWGRAAEKAAALGKADPAAAERRLDILLDIAEGYAGIRQYKEAAPIFETVAKDPSNPERAEAAHEQWAMALCKLGQGDASDAACKAFLEKYPASMLRPTVMFWQAENAYRRGVELAKQSDANPEEVKKLQGQADFGELSRAAAQYAAVVEKWPEFPQASAARFGLGMACYRQGDYAKAQKQLANVTESDRVGELATASYYQADCLIRAMPETAEDALSAARLAGQLEEAVKLLSTFVGSEDRPETPDGMLKLAECYQRQAAILADPQEKAKSLQGARETYDRLIPKYPKHPAYASAVMERAGCVAAMGDAGGAINELNRFRSDSRLSKSDVAPLALTRLAELMTRNGRAVDAAAMLDKARQDYEPQIKDDAKRSMWIPGLRYQHAVALKASGKTREALALFEAITKEFPDRPEAAEASLASIGVRKDEALARLKSAAQAVAAVPVDQAVDAKVAEAQAEAVKGVSEIATALGEHAERIAEKMEGSDLHVRTLRDAAASWRAVAETEIASARRARGAESLKRLKERLAKEPVAAVVASARSNSAPRPPEVKLASIPVTPAEQKARDLYNKALDTAPDSPICNDMRLDLARMYFDRGEADQTIGLLSAALDKNPAPEQAQKLRVRLGNAYLMKKDAAGAMKEALAALENANSPSRPAAYLVKGRAQMLSKDYGAAITTLSRYRNGAEKYVQAGPVTEEGLMRLAEAYAAAGNWEESRATYEHLLGRFGQGRFVSEAKFGAGLALQKAKQFDRAVEAYQEVTRRTGSELAARAQMQIGLCRAEQKRWQDAVNELLVVPGTYDYADVAANASLEAGKALVEMKEPAKAKDVLRRVVRDYSGTEWATAAQKRLAEIQ